MQSAKVGDSAPEFSATASLAGDEFEFSLKRALETGPVIIYFYPSAFTHGCNMEAHAFSRSIEKFDALRATVIGVSADSIVRLKAFSADPGCCAGKVSVASDLDGRIARLYGLNVSKGPAGMTDTRGVAIDHDFTERTTFVVDRGGRIAARLSSVEDKLTPIQHVERSLHVVQSFAASKIAE